MQERQLISYGRDEKNHRREFSSGEASFFSGEKYQQVKPANNFSGMKLFYIFGNSLNIN
jgi:hypothetical protein